MTAPDIAFAPTLTHRDVLEFATIDGARSIGLEDRVGSLTPGKQADIVLLKVNAINTAPMVDPVGTIAVFETVVLAAALTNEMPVLTPPSG